MKIIIFLISIFVSTKCYAMPEFPFSTVYFTKINAADDIKATKDHENEKNIYIFPKSPLKLKIKKISFEQSNFEKCQKLHELQVELLKNFQSYKPVDLGEYYSYLNLLGSSVQTEIYTQYKPSITGLSGLNKSLQFTEISPQKVRFLFGIKEAEQYQTKDEKNILNIQMDKESIGIVSEHTIWGNTAIPDSYNFIFDLNLGISCPINFPELFEQKLDTKNINGAIPNMVMIYSYNALVKKNIYLSYNLYDIYVFILKKLSPKFEVNDVYSNTEIIDALIKSKLIQSDNVEAIRDYITTVIVKFLDEVTEIKKYIKVPAIVDFKDYYYLERNKLFKEKYNNNIKVKFNKDKIIQIEDWIPILTE